MKFYFVHTSLSFGWISDFAHRAVVRSKRDGKPSLARSLYAHARPHRVCVHKATGAPRIQFSAWFVRPSLPRRTLGAYFAPLGSHWQLSPTKQILSFRFLRPTRESEGKREGDGTTTENKKIDGLVKNHRATVRYRIKNFWTNLLLHYTVIKTLYICGLLANRVLKHQKAAI